jgi:hypothetical protein
MTADEISIERLKRLVTVPEDFINGLTSVERAFNKAALILISQLEQSDGKILLNKRNIALLAEIESELKNLFLQTNYPKLVSNFIHEFNEQAKLGNDYFKKAFPGFELPKIASDILQLKKETTINLLLNDTVLDVEFIQPLLLSVEQAVTAQATFSETLTNISNIITGTSEIDSKITKYAKQISFDSFAVSDRTYTKTISDSLNAEWFKYAGDIIRDSRDFCITRHEKFYHKKEVEAWGDLEEWQGKMAGTNPQTIFQTAGGYNCKHDILPVSIFIVPKEVIQRNIANNNYEPSQFEIQELGL